MTLPGTTPARVRANGHPSRRRSDPPGPSPVRRAVSVAMAVLAVATLATGVDATMAVEPAGATTAMQLTPAEQAEVDRLNHWRAQRGLSQLAVDPVVQLHAREWTSHMATTQRIAHDATVRDDCFAASSTCRSWAENVGMARSSDPTAAAAAVFAGFEASSGHAANMASGTWTHVGIGVFRDASGQSWVTQRFVQCSCANDAVATNQNDQYTAHQRYVVALYDDFLNQGPGDDTADRAGLLLYGLPRHVLVSGFAYSDPWFGALVDHYYRSTLGRSADPAGLRHWIGVLRGGTSPAAVAGAFYASDEYFQRSGGTNRAWITDLYEEILRRTPDRQGLDHWSGIADRRGDRAGIAFAFYQSLESRLTRVGNLYAHLLDRRPDRDGAWYWSRVLLDGHDVRLAMFLASSNEYVKRVT